MKYTRLVIGGIAVVAALWIIVGEQMSGASADAVVNARIVTLRASVAGDLSLPSRPLGSRVTRGETLAAIEDPQSDRVRLNDLQMEARLATAEVARLAGLRDTTAALRDGFLARASLYRDERLAEARQKLDHARRRLEILENLDTAEVNAPQTLIDTIGDDADRLPGEPRRDALVLDHARERVSLLEIALRAAEQGVFLGDGYNDSPYAEQRASALEAELAGLSLALAAAEAKVAAVNERVSREQVRVNRLTGGEIAAPVNGLYWEVLEANGVTVQRGDPLLRLVDCGSVMVTLSVTERVFNRLSIGQAATFRLGGTSEVMEATVSRLAGSGAATVYRHLAVAPGQRHLERYDVALIVPALQQTSGEGCLIGRTGRAFFDQRPLDGLRALFR